MKKKRYSKSFLNSVIVLFALLFVGLVLFVKFSSTKQSPTPTQQPNVKSAESFELLGTPVSLTGRKSLAQESRTVERFALNDKNALTISYNLYGLCVLEGSAGTITLHQQQTAATVLISQLGKNCYEGEQEATVPLKDIQGLSTDTPIERIEFSLWYPTDFKVEILGMKISTFDENVLGTYSKSDSQEEGTSREFPPLYPLPFAKESQE